VPRLALLCALIVFAVVPAGAALASGAPVFSVVPAARTSHGSLSQAVHKQLKSDQQALLAAEHAQGSDAWLVHRAQSAVARAADPFPAEDRLARLRQTLAADTARVSSLRRAIKGLQLTLQPVSLPADFAASSPTTIGSDAVTIAERYINVPYVWGGASPDSGFDCSGFVKFVYAQLGIKLPHYAASQYATTMHVDPSQLEPGDLVFFEPHSDGPGHVGLYLGNDLLIAAPHTGADVRVTHLSTEAGLLGFVGASRPSA
jgi:cell wall-associated NlpC family hydrolase